MPILPTTGMLLRLAINHGATRSTVMRAEMDGNHLLLATPTDGGHLRIGPGARRVDFQGGRGPWARFVMEEDAEGYRIKNVGHANKGADIYLAGYDTAGELTFSIVSQAASAPVFLLMPIEGEEIAVMDMDLGGADKNYPPWMTSVTSAPQLLLSDEMKAQFVSDGYLVLRGAVSQQLVEDALRTINSTLGEGPSAWREDDDGKQKLATDGHPSLLNLLYASPAFGVAQQLLGEDGLPISHGPRGAQVALRFPNPVGQSKARRHEAREGEDVSWHIDGMKKPHMSPFNLLLGVALSAQPTDDCGNLGLWAGAHQKVHDAVVAQRRLRVRRWRASNGQPPRPEEAADAEEEAAALTATEDPDHPWLGHRPVLAEDGSAVTQIKLQPGDVVIAHQRLPHRISANTSPHIRYQVYFRISSRHHKPNAPTTQGPEGLWKAFTELGQEVKELGKTCGNQVI